MSAEPEPLDETAEELFEEAPCGFLSTRPDGTIVRVNRTFEAWTGYRREELVGRRRFQELLAPGGRIYHETHYAPLLRMQGTVREIAVELERADGSRLPALLNSVLLTDDAGRPRLIRTTVFDATDRRRYEEELLRAQQREREIAQRLQRSLLSGRMPTAESVHLDVAYRPGVIGLEVGGDWYDAFELGDGETLGLVVGDVVGHGLEAAATMGQLRSAVRALAATVPEPGRLLEALDAYSSRHEVGQMATVVYAQLHVPSGRVRFSCAGHPPPVVVPADGEPRQDWSGRSFPLDAAGGVPAQRPQGTLTLGPGDALLLHTDGLVERRDRGLDDGFDHLLAVLRGVQRPAETDLAEFLVHTLHDPAHLDDVCVLAARLAAVPAAA